MASVPYGQRRRDAFTLTFRSKLNHVSGWQRKTGSIRWWICAVIPDGQIFDANDFQACNWARIVCPVMLGLLEGILSKRNARGDKVTDVIWTQSWEDFINNRRVLADEIAIRRLENTIPTLWNQQNVASEWHWRGERLVKVSQETRHRHPLTIKRWS